METATRIEFTGARKTGRCADGAERGAGRIVHAITAADAVQAEISGSWARAACGTKPGRLAQGWTTVAAGAVTCPACLRALARTPSASLQSKGGAA